MAERLFTWVVSVTPGELASVKDALETIRSKPSDNPLIPFGRLPMVHFANLTLFDDDPDEPPSLVFESNIDEPVCDYLGALVAVGRHGLDLLFSSDADYRDCKSPADVVRYLRRRRKRPQLYHIGHPNLSVQEIRGDAELRRSIKAELDRDGELREKAPADIVVEIRRRTHCPSALRPLVRPWHPSWAAGAPAEPTPLDQIQWPPDRTAWRRYLRALSSCVIAWATEIAFVLLLDRFFRIPVRQTMLVAGVIMALLVHMSSSDTRLLRGILEALLVAGLVAKTLAALTWWYETPVRSLPSPFFVAAVVAAGPLVPIALSYGHILAKLTVTAEPPTLDAAKLRQLVDAEDRPEHDIYNHVAGLSILRENFHVLRRVRTLLALQFLNLFYRTYFVKGKLVTIPSIHFAQWSLVDDRRLLFLTNYDGSADSYLDDFFNSLAAGVAFIWFDTKLFPRTSDARLLKLWVRQGQTLAAVKYRAPVYEGLSVTVINSNYYIRARLLRGRGRASARRWLRRLTTAPVEPSVLARFIGWLKPSAGGAS